MEVRKSDWLCVGCGELLGSVFGGEFYPKVAGEFLRTNGPNLVVTCPKCKQLKTFYTSDPVVRAIYQLVNAISDVAAKTMIEQIAREINSKTR